jgi:AcrR family transcriptional regulator
LSPEERRQQILSALTLMIRRGTYPATMADLARVAGLSTATAYRQFASLEEVNQAYRLQTTTDLGNFCSARPEEGIELLYVMSRYWVDTVQKHGAVLVQIRSRLGFFDRLHANVASTIRGKEARRRALCGVLDALGLSSTLQDEADMLYTVLFDPREVLDMINLRGFAPEKVVTVLVSCYLGALKGWGRGERAWHEGGRAAMP